MTSRSDVVMLRARVLYYWTSARGTSEAIGSDAIAKLLSLESWSEGGTMESEIVKALGRVATVKWLPGGGLRIALPSHDDVAEVFAYWKQATGKTRSKLSQVRRSKIHARIVDGFSADDLKRVVDGALRSPWYCGDNPSRTPYLGIETLFKSADSVERLMAAGTAQQAAAFEADEVESIRAEWRSKR